MVQCDNCGWRNPDGMERCEKCNAPLMFDVFISYSRKDYIREEKVIPSNVLSKIKDAFKANGISYWFDEEGIYSGDEFAGVLTKAIRNSKVFLFISSVNSNQSIWTSNEISTAIEFGKTIIPFRIDSSPYNDSVMMKIVSYDYIECKSGDEDSAINKLLRAVRHHLPLSSGFERSRWRNVDVPEGAKGTIVAFNVGGEWKEQVFSSEDNCRSALGEAKKKELSDERRRGKGLSLNARYKGCALTVAIALGLLLLIGFLPFTNLFDSPVDDNRQIAKADDGRLRVPLNGSSEVPELQSYSSAPESESSPPELESESSLPMPKSGSSPADGSLSTQNRDRANAAKLGNEAYDALLQGKFSVAENLSRMGMKMDSTQHWLATNLAAALLFQGKTEEAEKIYLQYRVELKADFLDDFKAFGEEGIIPEERKKDVERIKLMLGK